MTGPAVPGIALAPEDTTRSQAERAFQKAGVKIRTVIETPYSTTICAMVAAGVGVGLVNPLTAEPYLKDGLSLRPFEPALQFRTLMIMPPHRQPSHILQDFISDLKRAATSNPAAGV